MKSIRGGKGIGDAIYLAAVVRQQRDLGRELQRADRFPFYGIVPAELGAVDDA